MHNCDNSNLFLPPFMQPDTASEAKQVLASLFAAIHASGDGHDQKALDAMHDLAVGTLSKVNAGLRVNSDTFVGLDDEQRRHVLGAFAASAQQTADVRLQMLQAELEATVPDYASIEWGDSADGLGDFCKLRGKKYVYEGVRITKEGGPHDGMVFYSVVNEQEQEVWITEASPHEYIQVFMQKEAVEAGFAN